MKLIIDMPEEYYNLLKGFDDEKCSMDMLLLKYIITRTDGIIILIKNPCCVFIKLNK